MVAAEYGFISFYFYLFLSSGDGSDYLLRGRGNNPAGTNMLVNQTTYLKRYDVSFNTPEPL